MRDLVGQLRDWHASGVPYALATVTATTGSAPHAPGATLAVHADGRAVGSVSGGCVEAAVYELSRQVIADGTPVTERFGYSDADAFAVGLTCGGELEVLVQPVHTTHRPEKASPDAALEAAFRCVTEGRPVALARCVEGPSALVGSALAVTGAATTGDLPEGFAALGEEVGAQARALLHAGRTATLTLTPDGRPCPPESGGSVRILVESWTAPPRMLIFGAVDFAAATARIGRFLGYRVTVCDARPVFATPARFPEADEVVVAWPHDYLDAQLPLLDARSVICVLTHDAKFDIPLLQRALRAPVGLVGAMGSRRTHADRVQRLRAVGLTETEIARLRSPIGLDLGGRTPEETAVSIAAEIIADRNHGGCLPLTRGAGPLHRPASAPAGGIPERPAPMSPVLA